MKTKYVEIKDKVLELNRINDEIDLIEWNKDDGPKFDSVKEMKEFEERILNGDLDYIFNDDKESETSSVIDNVVETFNHILEDYTFYIYTYKKDNNYITYMSIKYLDDEDSINNIYGYKTTDKEESDSYFEKLKTSVITNSLDYTFNKILSDIENDIKKLKTKYNELANES